MYLTRPYAIFCILSSKFYPSDAGLGTHSLLSIFSYFRTGDGDS